MAAQRGLERLASLYTMMDRMRSLEVQLANDAVEDALCSSAIATTIRESQIEDGRDALATGRPEAWRVAETTRGLMDRRIELLRKVRTECEAVLAEASRVHRASRLQMEQMKCLVEKTRTLTLLHESRRAQSAADDRFASRSAWMKLQRVQDAQ